MVSRLRGIGFSAYTIQPAPPPTPPAEPALLVSWTTDVEDWNVGLAAPITTTDVDANPPASGPELEGAILYTTGTNNPGGSLELNQRRGRPRIPNTVDCLTVALGMTQSEAASLFPGYTVPGSSSWSTATGLGISLTRGEYEYRGNLSHIFFEDYQGSNDTFMCVFVGPDLGRTFLRDASGDDIVITLRRTPYDFS